MARKKIRTTFGGRPFPKKRTRGVAEFGVIPDPRTKAAILRDLDKKQDALTAANDAAVILSKASTELHARIQDLEAIEDDLKQQLTQMRGQRDQLLDAIEDFEEADHEAKVRNQNRDVAHARMSDLHSEIGTERSNEMVRRIEPLNFKFDMGSKGWRQHKGAGI